MLVLERRQGDSIRIGDDITIHFVKVAGGRVRVAFDAPLDCGIVRTELIDAMASAIKPATRKTSCNKKSDTTISAKIGVQ